MPSLPTALISRRVFLKSFCISQLPHKCVNLFFTITTRLSLARAGRNEVYYFFFVITPEPTVEQYNNL